MSQPVKILHVLLDKAKTFGLGDFDLTTASGHFSDGEYGLCLDTIVTQVHACNLSIDDEFYTLVNIASERIGLPLGNYYHLKPLIKR